MGYLAHRHAPAPCPSCDEPLDAAAMIGGVETPAAGDWTICVYCLTWLRFTETMGLREATAAEIADARANVGPEMELVERAIRAAMREGGR
jgi:hypothetical protein